MSETELGNQIKPPENRVFIGSSTTETPGAVYMPPVEDMPKGDMFEVWKASVENPGSTILGSVFEQQGIKIDWNISEGLNWRGKVHLLEEGGRLLPMIDVWKKNGLTSDQISQNVNSILGLTKQLVEKNPIYTSP